jgi:pyruvate formate lyase activating enzyme
LPRPCSQPHPPPTEDDSQFIREAKFYEKLPYKKTKCKLCPRECVIDDQERGYCGVRENRGGTYSHVGALTRGDGAHRPHRKEALLSLFMPGAVAFSHRHRRLQRELQDVPELGHFPGPSRAGPRHLRAAREGRGVAQQNSCPVIAYTYSEPVVFLEYVLDCAAAGRAAGVRSAVVSGGYIQAEPLKKLCAQVDAIKIDLKGLFRKVLQGSREW